MSGIEMARRKKFFTVARVVFPIGVDKHFDYFVNEGMHIEEGMRVLVSFGGRRRVGLVVSLAGRSSCRKLNPVIKVLDRYPSLTGGHFKFARRLAEQYLYSFGEMAFLMLPPLLRRGGRVEFSRWAEGGCVDAGRSAEIVTAHDFSNRFSLYTEAIERALATGSVVVCFPLLSHLEDALSVLREYFDNNVVILHSYLSDRDVFEAWRKIREGRKLVVGTRGVLFYYPSDLNLIVVEEENSKHYFQPEKPYYHLVDVAHLLHKFKKARLILSSDYPSLFAYRRYRKYIYEKYTPRRPRFQIFDYSSSHTPYKNRRRVLTPLVIELVRKNIAENKRVLLLWSKGGFSVLVRCSACGKILECARCSGFLKFSSKGNVAFCPRCGYSQSVDRLCHFCGEGYLRPLGVGIERLESIVKRIFPEVEAKRWDEAGQNTKILFSTYQILNVSLSRLPEVDVAFALDVDSLLSLTDYDSTFNLFVSLMKVSRFVRDTFCVFTYNPRHYIWEGLMGSWRRFYRKELALRKQLGLPPFGTVIRLTLRGKNKNGLQKKAESLYNVLKARRLDVFGPLEEVPFKLRDKYRYSVVVKGPDSGRLRKELKGIVASFRRGTYKLAVVIR